MVSEVEEVSEVELVDVSNSLYTYTICVGSCIGTLPKEKYRFVITVWINCSLRILVSQG